MSSQGGAQQQVARRLQTEVGVPRDVALRMARNLDDLAENVDWATPTYYYQALEKAKEAEEERAKTVESGRKKLRAALEQQRRAVNALKTIQSQKLTADASNAISKVVQSQAAANKAATHALAAANSAYVESSRAIDEMYKRAADAASQVRSDKLVKLLERAMKKEIERKAAVSVVSHSTKTT